MSAEDLKRSEEASKRARRFMEIGELEMAHKAYVEAADFMMRFASDQQGQRRMSAQLLTEQLLQKAQETQKQLQKRQRPQKQPVVNEPPVICPAPIQPAPVNPFVEPPVVQPVPVNAPPVVEPPVVVPPAVESPVVHAAPAEKPAKAKEGKQEPSNQSAISRDLKSWDRGGGTLNSDAENRLKFKPVECPNVHFSDIAGLDQVKSLIRLKVIEPILHPALFERFSKTSNGGILLYGPPGTGKTMIARAIATETGLDFFSVRCSDIVGKNFGDGERNLRGLFDAARESGRAIIFFDEFESLACKRGGGSTVMNRIVPELLSQMDGFQQAEGTLVVLASTNRPWDLDSAVLRPPRMTERIYVGLPDFAARHYMVKKALEPLPKQEMLDYDAIANALEGYNCADITAFVEKVKEAPIQRGLMDPSTEQYICNEDVERALENSHSSVQKSDLEAFSKWEATQR